MQASSAALLPSPQRAEGPAVVEPVDHGQHQPLQGENERCDEQARQRAVRHLLEQIRAGSRKIDPADLEKIVATVVVQLAGTELTIEGIAMLRRLFKRL